MNILARNIVLAASLVTVSGTVLAQTADPAATTTDTAVVVEDDNDFPWGLIGLLGLAGLLGRKRDVVVRDDRSPNDAIRR